MTDAPRPRGGRRPSAGRPPSADPRSAQLPLVRVTPGELAELHARADDAGQPLAEYVRDALFLARPTG